MTVVRHAAVAGQFYPADAERLAAGVRALIDDAGAPQGPAPKALIVPHAGYQYSGTVAAVAYARLRAHRERYRRVALLGPCHYVGVRGLAFSGADVFRTPLGDVPLSRPPAVALQHPATSLTEATHGPEHSLEVQLPFLQSVLDDFVLTPIVVGQTPAASVADVLEQLWDGPETLIVVSTDLSHYQDYAHAREHDSTTCAAIEELAPERISSDDACGAFALNGLLTLARRKRLEVRTLDLRNSGDTAGSRERVVGYGAWMLIEPAEDKA